MRFKRLGIVGRFKPLHNGSARTLEKMCEFAEHVMIGIGSTNRYDLRNPFTAIETRDMIDIALRRHDNYSILYLKDYGDRDRWKETVFEKFGELDGFVTGNPYVKEILAGRYSIIPPEMLGNEKGRGTEVRVKMAEGGDWKSLVHDEVAQYLIKNELVDRFVAEFGEATLKSVEGKDYTLPETLGEAIKNTL